MAKEPGPQQVTLDEINKQLERLKKLTDSDKDTLYINFLNFRQAYRYLRAKWLVEEKEKELALAKEVALKLEMEFKNVPLELSK